MGITPCKDGCARNKCCTREEILYGAATLLTGSGNGGKEKEHKDAGAKKPEFGSFQKKDDSRKSAGGDSRKSAGGNEKVVEKQTRVTSKETSDREAKSSEKEESATAEEAREPTNEEQDEEKPREFTEAKRKEIYGQAMTAENDDDVILLAAYMGDSKILDEYIAKDGAVETADKKGFSCGYHAALSGDVASLQVLRKYDTNDSYREYFEDSLTIDGITPMMEVLRHGNPRIIKFLMQTCGFKAKLLGPRFGDRQYPDGLGLPLDSWYAFIPEITQPAQLMRRRPLYLSTEVFDAHKHPSHKDYELAKKQRLDVRKVIFDMCQANKARKSLPEDEDEDTAAPTTAARESVRKTSKRSSAIALPLPFLSAASGGGDVSHMMTSGASALEHDVEAKVICPGATNHIAKHKSAEEDEDSQKCIWMCGSCNQLHNQPTSMSEHVIECDACHKKNLIHKPADPHHHHEGASGSEGEQSDDEMFENDEDEDVSEEVIDKYIIAFKGSEFTSLPSQKLRQFLRVAEVKKFKKEKEVFKEKDPANVLHILLEGTVGLQTEADRKKNVDKLVKQYSETIEVDKKHAVSLSRIVRVISLNTFLNKDGSYKTSCIVDSNHATVFQFKKARLCDSCGVESIEDIVKMAQAHFLMNQVPLFTFAFTQEERDKLADIIEYRKWEDGKKILSKGDHIENIVLVQHGRLAITKGEDDIGSVKGKIVSKEIVRVGPEQAHAHLPKGESWQPVFVLGIRNLLYDLGLDANITAEGQPVEAWTLRISKADGLLVETNTINHLQLGTQVMVLQNVRFLKRLDPHDPRLRSLVMHCPTQEFWQKQNIIEQGSSGDTFYILMEGTVQVQVDGKVVATQAADIDHGQVYYFGEVAALQQKVAKRNATVRVTSKAANVLCVSSGNIDETFGSLESLLEEEGTTLKEVLGDQMIEKKVHKSKKKGDVPTSEDLSEQIRKQSLASATHESVLKPQKKGKKAAEEDDDDEQMKEYKKMFKKVHEKELEAKNAKAKAKGKAGSSHQVKLAMVT